MGWTCTCKPKQQSVSDFLLSSGVFTWSDESPNTYKVLDSAFVNFSEFYAAVECINKQTGERRVFASITLVTLHKDSRNNICYKDMDESCGPCAYNCPLRILNKLTPTVHEYANEWRERCHQRLQSKKNASKFIASLTVGSLIEFEQPVTFKNGYSSNQFRVSRKEGKRIIFNDNYVFQRGYLIGSINEGTARLIS